MPRPDRLPKEIWMSIGELIPRFDQLHAWLAVSPFRYAKHMYDVAFQLLFSELTLTARGSPESAAQEVARVERIVGRTRWLRAIKHLRIMYDPEREWWDSTTTSKTAHQRRDAKAQTTMRMARCVEILIPLVDGLQSFHWTGSTEVFRLALFPSFIIPRLGRHAATLTDVCLESLVIADLARPPLDLRGLHTLHFIQLEEAHMTGYKTSSDAVLFPKSLQMAVFRNGSGSFPRRPARWLAATSLYTLSELVVEGQFECDISALWAPLAPRDWLLSLHALTLHGIGQFSLPLDLRPLGNLITLTLEKLVEIPVVPLNPSIPEDNPHAAALCALRTPTNLRFLKLEDITTLLPFPNFIAGNEMPCLQSLSVCDMALSPADCFYLLSSRSPVGYYSITSMTFHRISNALDHLYPALRTARCFPALWSLDWTFGNELFPANNGMDLHGLSQAFAAIGTFVARHGDSLDTLRVDTDWNIVAKGMQLDPYLLQRIDQAMLDSAFVRGIRRATNLSGIVLPAVVFSPASPVFRDLGEALSQVHHLTISGGGFEGLLPTSNYNPPFFTLNSFLDPFMSFRSLRTLQLLRGDFFGRPDAPVPDHCPTTHRFVRRLGDFLPSLRRVMHASAVYEIERDPRSGAVNVVYSVDEGLEKRARQVDKQALLSSDVQPYA